MDESMAADPVPGLKRPRVVESSMVSEDMVSKNLTPLMDTNMHTSYLMKCQHEGMVEDTSFGQSQVSIDDTDVKVTREIKGPRIQFSSTVKEQLYKPWRNSLIIKLMGKPLAYNYFVLKLRQKWSLLKGNWRLIDIANDYYVAKFDLEEDLNYILGGGPWIIAGQYLAIQKWKPGFDAYKDTITHLTVWVRISGLHVEWFDAQCMKRIGDLLGTTQRVDLRTSSHVRGKFARICVEIDLTKPLEAYIQVEDEWYQLQYEGLHLVCFHCGHYGHDITTCPLKVSKEIVAEPSSTVHAPKAMTSTNDQQCSMENTSSTTHQMGQTVTNASGLNEWNLVAPRRGRRPTRNVNESTWKENGRFNVLSELETEDLMVASKTIAPIIQSQGDPSSSRTPATISPRKSNPTSRVSSMSAKQRGKGMVGSGSKQFQHSTGSPSLPAFSFNVAEASSMKTLSKEPIAKQDNEDVVPHTLKPIVMSQSPSGTVVRFDRPMDANTVFSFNVSPLANSHSPMDVVHTFRSPSTCNELRPETQNPISQNDPELVQAEMMREVSDPPRADSML